MGKTSKDKRDIYYRLAKEEGWRARSAYKLLHLDENYNLFTPDVTRVVDLCAAPGSWSQVLSQKVSQPGSKIVAVDLQPMAPLPNVVQLQGDITQVTTAQAIIAHFDGLPADLVVCDGAPDVTGLHEWDMFLQGHLLIAALHITTHVLKPGGTFVAKVFRGPLMTDIMQQQFNVLFTDVTFCKPSSSRSSSYESFVVARNYSPPAEFQPAALTDFLEHHWDVGVLEKWGEFNRKWIPFMAQGDLSGWDSETTFPFHPDYVHLDPVQPPTAPPYKEALDRKRGLNQSCEPTE